MTEREMPKYRCHKTVWTLKIAKVDGNQLIPEDENYGPIPVSQEYLRKHNPQQGYYVQYQDGYVSWSPTKAFEEGYTRIER